MITMTEIARLTNVSQPTVSRVLNGNKAVDPEIRERVLACAREHDYQLNALAKSLQGRQTHLLGVMLNDLSNSFFADLASEIEANARRHGYSIILFNTNHDAQRQREYIDVMRRYRVDGLLISPVLRDPAIWQECVRKLDIPAVAVTKSVAELDAVYVDHEQAARQAARHLAAQGYEKFLFIGKPTDNKYHGFAQELEALGLGPAGQVPCFEQSEDDAFLRELQNHLPRGARTGIFANNDLWALRVLNGLWELSIDVPTQAGVIGFDDITLDRYLHPRLSSISQPIAEMARSAVERLLIRIERGGHPPKLDLPLQASLVPRESS